MIFKLNSRYRLEKVAFDDESRPALQCIRVEGDRAIATDGHILANVPIERTTQNATQPEKVNLLLTPRCWLDAIRKKDKLDDYTVTVENDDVNSELNYPNWKGVVPDKAEHIFEFGLDAELLYKLSQGLGNKKLILSIDMKKQDDHTPAPILARPLEYDTGNGAQGLIVQLRIEDI